MSVTIGVAESLAAAVLMIAGLLKLGSFRTFGQQIVTYELIPKALARAAGYLLPPAEIVIGILLIFMPRIAIFAAALFTVFAVAVGINVVRGRTELHCGCFGETGIRTISTAHVEINVGLATISILAFFWNLRPSFVEFQIGVTVVLVAVLADAWRTMRPRLAEGAKEQ
jgi:hypothetical protein